MYKLLVVEDEPEIRQGLASYFPWGNFGFELVAQAENGAQALDVIKRQPVDVVLSDIKMPVMDGLAMCQQLAALPAPPVVVLLTGYRDFEYAQKAIEYGVKKYLLKPTDYKVLMDTFTQIRTELDARGAAAEGAPEPEAPAEGFYDQILNQVKGYIHENLKTATLQEAAERVHISAPYLSRLFKSRLDMNFSEYLITCKVQRAKEMLRSPGYKIHTISSELGYSNANNFSRTFKQYTGQTPYQYRASHPREGRG